MYNSWGNIYFLNPRELRWREKSRYGDSRDERYFWTKKYTIYTITLYKLQTSRYSRRNVLLKTFYQLFISISEYTAKCIVI